MTDIESSTEERERRAADLAAIVNRVDPRLRQATARLAQATNDDRTDAAITFFRHDQPGIPKRCACAEIMRGSRIAASFPQFEIPPSGDKGYQPKQQPSRLSFNQRTAARYMSRLC